MKPRPFRRGRRRPGAVESTRRRPGPGGWGQALRQSGNWDAAGTEKAVALAPGDAKAQAWRGEILRKQGLGREAEAALARAVALDPACAWARALLGEARRDAGKSAAGLADFQEALRIDGGCSCAYDILGAEPASVRADPNWAWVYAWRGAISRRDGNWAGARKDFDRALKLDPRSPWARAWRGELLLARGELSAAVADLEAALGLLPSYAEARPGWTRPGRGRDLDAAVQLPIGSRSSSQRLPEVRLGAAVALKEAGRLEPALAECRAVISGGVRAPGVWELRADLEASLGMAGPAWKSPAEAIVLRPGPGAEVESRQGAQGAGLLPGGLASGRSGAVTRGLGGRGRANRRFGKSPGAGPVVGAAPPARPRNPGRRARGPALRAVGAGRAPRGGEL